MYERILCAAVASVATAAIEDAGKELTQSDNNFTDSDGYFEFAIDRLDERLYRLSYRDA